MEYLRIDGEFPRLTNSAVTLGKFDGIHKGHRKLVENILQQKEYGLKSVLCAFDSASQGLLTSQERRRILEEMGVDILLECPLSNGLKHMKADAFVKEVLVGDLQAAYVAVGEDFRFGYERKGTPSLLCELGKKHGFQVQILPKEMDGRRKISSTFIREELKHGNMEKVTVLLGYDFIVDGVVKHGRGLGHKLLFPTTNLIPPKDKLMPPNGVYVTVSRFGERVYKGITNIGYKPTVGERFLGVETYLFDCQKDLYGRECSVSFKKFLRPEKKFHSLDLLKEQMQRDIQRGKEYFEENPVAAG